VSAPKWPDDPRDWLGRQEAVRRWMPYASRGALECFAWTEFNRADTATFHIIDERERADLLAQRQASLAISAAIDWTAVSRRPSHAELQRRRSVVA